VYTPSFVVNGKKWSGFFNREAPPKSTMENARLLTVTLKREKEAIASFVPDQSVAGRLILEVALLGTDLQSDVKRGETAAVIYIMISWC
jgi:hypothetical protein